jgi:hypothetical protein
MFDFLAVDAILKRQVERLEGSLTSLLAECFEKVYSCVEICAVDVFCWLTSSLRLDWRREVHKKPSN